jgi:hypothetical protein
VRNGRNYLRLAGVRVGLALLVSLVVGGFAVSTAAYASPGHAAPQGHGRRAQMVGGVVTAVNGSSFTITQRDGSTEVIATNGDTKYTESGNPSAPAGVAVGDKVLVKLTDATTPTASKVAILLASLGGKVVSTSASAITITDGQGFTRTVNVSGATRYFRDKNATTLSDVKAGDMLRAFGNVDGAALDAMFVHVHTPGTANGPKDDRHHVVRGTVTAVGANGFTIKQADGSTQTIVTNADTKYAEAGTRTAPAGVAVGDRVLVKLTDASTPTAQRVFIVLVQLRGTVASVSGGDITLTDDGGFTRTVHTDGSTVFTKDGKPIALTDVVAGQRISAYGHIAGSALDALFVNVHDPRPKPAPASQSGTTVHDPSAPKGGSSTPGGGDDPSTPFAGPTNRSINGRADDNGQHEGNKPGSFDNQQRVMGIVQSITGNTITVQTPDNQTKTVNVTSATTYKTADNQTATLSDIKVGDQLMAVGTLNSDGSLTAAQVFFRTPGPNDHPPSSGGDPRPGGWNGSGGGPGGPGSGSGGFQGGDGGRGGRH